MNELSLSINEKMNLFYHLTSIPIHLFSDEEYLFSFSPNTDNLHQIFHWFMEKIHPSLQNTQFTNCLTIMNDLEEVFFITPIFIHDDNHFVVSGPYIIGHCLEDFINKLIMKRKTSLKSKESLLKTFKTRRLLSDSDSIYFKQLFNELFTASCSKYNRKENALSEKFYIHRIENKERWYTHPPYYIEQKLLLYIKEGNAKEAEKMVQSLNTYHDAILSKNPIRSFKNSLICRCTLYTRAIIEGGVDSETAFTLSDTYINEIEKISDIQDLYHLDIKMVSEFTKLILSKINRLYSPLVQSTLKIVKESINEKINVNDIALRIPANPNYLSQVFKKEVGISLSAYINQQKIDEAKYFLSYTNSSIIDISNFFNFSSQSHFTSIFKKYIGVTPQAYRKNYSL